MQARSTAVSTSSPPTDDTLRRFVGYRLKRANITIRGDLLAKLELLGLRITSYSPLVLIADNPGRRQSELASALVMKRPTIAAIIDELEASEWVARKRIPSDRRLFALYATGSGQRVCQQVLAVDTRHESEPLHCPGPDEHNRLSALLLYIESSAG